MLADSLFFFEFPDMLDFFVDIFCNSLSGAFLSLGDENFHFNQLQN
jgi:hypothetical protein